MTTKKDSFIQEEISYLSDHFKICIRNKTPHRPEKAFHKAIEIKYLYEGRTMQMIGSDIIVSEPGDITVVNPYELHTNMETELYDGKYYLIMIDPDFLLEANPNGIDLRSLLITKRQSFTHYIKNDAHLQSILLQIIEELREQKEYYRPAVYDLISHFFILLLRDYLNHDAAEINEMRKSSLIAPALEKIFTNYDQQLSIDELANLCHISSYYFCRVFKEQMGVTVVQYITRYRISLAHAMLADESRPIEEIADRCGFRDISYFYRCYKRIMGTSPKKGADRR